MAEVNPATRARAAAVLSSPEGHPSAGGWRVRDGQEAAAQWRLGGVPGGITNYPRIFDLANSGDQSDQLKYTPSTADVGRLTPDDFAQVTLLTQSR